MPQCIKAHINASNGKFSVQWRCWASYYDEALPFYSDINLWNVSRWKIFSKILNNNYMDLQFCMKMNCLIGVIRKNMIYWKALMVKLEHYLYIYVQESPVAYDERWHVKFGWNSFLITIFGNSICLLRFLFVSAYSLKLSVCLSVHYTSSIQNIYYFVLPKTQSGISFTQTRPIDKMVYSDLEQVL